MIHFQDVLPAARKVIASSGIDERLAGVLVLRDLRGRVRFFLQSRESEQAEVEARCGSLAEQFERELAPFWGGVVEVDDPKSEFAQVLAGVRNDAVPIDPQSSYPGWTIVERHVAKSAWTSGVHDPPWPLKSQTPGIVAWYSHKGGVGRSTALCATAIHFARAGRRVCVVDLDLESPGLGSLLSGTALNCGVLDYLLERMLGSNSFNPDIEAYLTRQSDPALIGDGGEPIVCVPAGTVDQWYLEKLARLDYELLAAHDLSAPNPLRDLLSHVRREVRPDVFLVDCRAGFHELGGMAVQQVSHANVLFGLDSQQSWDGLRHIVRRLGRLSRTPCLVVQAMEERAPGPRRDDSRARFLQTAYDVFCEEFYDENDVPDIGAEEELHNPFHIPLDTRLSGFQSLTDVAEILMDKPYAELADRIAKLQDRATEDAS